MRKCHRLDTADQHAAEGFQQLHAPISGTREQAGNFTQALTALPGVELQRLPDVVA